MKMQLVLALALFGILVGMSVESQTTLTEKPAPKPNSAEVDSKYGVTNPPNCPNGSNAEFWGLTTTDGTKWVPVYRCITQ